MKKASVVGLIVIGGVLSSPFFVDDELARTGKNVSVCADVLKTVAHETNVKVTKAESNDTALSLADAKKWVQNKYSSQKLIGDIIKLIEKDYQVEDKMIKSYVFVGYEANGRKYDSLRSGFLCSYIKDPFGNSQLESITYKSKGYKDLSSLFITRERPSRLSLVGIVEKPNYIDKLRYVFESVTHING